MAALRIPFAASIGALCLATATALAQPARPGAVIQNGDDIPLDDYLGLLTRIAPAARDGAQAYLQAYQQRCGRPLKTAELRRAMSDGDGDPVLMAMIRASHLRDANALTSLGQRVVCEQRSAR